MRGFQGVLDAIGPELDTPAPVVLIDVVRENIDRMQRFADAQGIRVRPHVKTHKCVEVAELQREAGAVGLTAGTIGEAEVFADAGFDDILLAYPVWPAGTKGERIRRLARRIRLSVGVDSTASIDALADAMGEDAERLEIVVEVDCGARRSGAPPAEAGALAAHARDRGLSPVGVYTYPGHGGRRGARERAARDQAAALTVAAASCREAGVEPLVVSAGSTPTAEFSTDPVITEIRPGEYVFYDLDNRRLGDCTGDQIGLFVASTVVSARQAGQVILDVGTKALGREGDEERGYGAIADDGPRLTKLNEYHGYLGVPEDAAPPRVGAIVPVVPTHVCPVVNSFDELIVTDRSGAMLERWQVQARGRLN